MRTRSKPILCLDFDGVCHSYTSGWQGETILPDPPVEGLFEFLKEATLEFEIHVFSTRSNTAAGRKAMQEWFAANFQKWLAENEESSDSSLKLLFPFSKPHASVFLDDRALTFTGVWPELDSLLSFKPWNKK